uniref:Uncharacterized protein n=1 Tax=Mastacembelus armatus TaxID=205130 RepID=A0A7N9AU56_9TELE
MKGIYRDGYYDGSIELRDVFNRRCIKCGRGDFVQAKTMRIRTGIVFWNLVFSLMFTCVKGMSHCSNFLYFLMRLACLIFRKILASFQCCHMLITKAEQKCVSVFMCMCLCAIYLMLHLLCEILISV